MSRLTRERACISGLLWAYALPRELELERWLEATPSAGWEPKINTGALVILDHGTQPARLLVVCGTRRVQLRLLASVAPAQRDGLARRLGRELDELGKNE